MVTHHQQVVIPRQFAGRFRHLAHGQPLGALDATDRVFVRLPDVDQLHFAVNRGQQALRGSDGDFERVFRIRHGDGEVGGGALLGNDRKSRRCGQGLGGTSLAGGRAGKIDGLETLRQGIVGQEASQQRFAAARDQLDRFQRLQAANDPAQRPQHADFTATRHAARRGWFREQAPVAGTVEMRGEHRDLTFEPIDTAEDQRSLGPRRGVVVQVAGPEIVGAVDDHIVVREQLQGVVSRDAFCMQVDRHMGIGGAQPVGGGVDLAQADRVLAVQELALEVVGFDRIEIGDTQRSDAGGREIKCRRTAEAAGADHQHPGFLELGLAGHPHLGQQHVTAVAGEFGRGQVGHGAETDGRLPESANDNCSARRPALDCPTMAKRYIVIIAGGKGERFWPQSREVRPKHLLPVVGDKALLVQTIDRVKPIVPAKQIFVITSAVQEKGVRALCKGLPRENIIAEPVGRDTAAAVGLAAAIVGARDPDGVFAILPADHVIHDGKKYQADLNVAFAAAEQAPVMVTIGITPTEPATGFGYVQRGDKWKTLSRRPVYAVKRFVEKPKLPVAKRYLQSGDYFWNAGMFVWSVKVVEAAIAQFAPKLDRGLAKIRAALAKGQALTTVMKKVYPSLDKISVDYALLEKSTNVVMLSSTFDWDDVGAWPAVARHYPQDAAGNVGRGQVLVEQGANNIVFSEGDHLVAVVGADDLIVVHTPEATLVCPKSKAQEIKTLLKQVQGLPKAKRYL